MIIKQDFIQRYLPARPGKLLSHPKGVVIEYADSYRLNKTIPEAYHFVIRKDEVRQYIPVGEIALPLYDRYRILVIKGADEDDINAVLAIIGGTHED